MSQLFPYANTVVGALILGFGFRWIAQVGSLLNWGFAERIGLQDKRASPEDQLRMRNIAVLEATTDWTFGVAGIRLILGASWGPLLVWIPGVVLIFRGVRLWAWHPSRHGSGSEFVGAGKRAIWCLGRLLVGSVAVAITSGAV